MKKKKDSPELFADILEKENEVDGMIASIFIEKLIKSKSIHTIHNIKQLFKNTFLSNQQNQKNKWTKFFRHLHFKNQMKIQNFPAIYETDIELGSGTYGKVFLYFFEDFTPIAVKKTYVQIEEHEFKILKQLKHPNIITFYGVVSMKPHNLILLEFIPGGTLEESLKNKKGHYSEDGLNSNFI